MDTDAVNMSLDDIIKQNRLGRNNNQGGNRGQNRDGSHTRSTTPNRTYGGQNRGRSQTPNRSYNGQNRGHSQNRSMTPNGSFNGNHGRSQTPNRFYNAGQNHGRSQTPNRSYNQGQNRGRSQTPNRFYNGGQNRGRSQTPNRSFRSNSRSRSRSRSRQRSQSRSRFTPRGRAGLEEPHTGIPDLVQVGNYRGNSNIFTKRQNQQNYNQIRSQTFSRSRNDMDDDLTVSVSNNFAKRQHSNNYLNKNSLKQLNNQYGYQKSGPGSVKSMGSYKSNRSNHSNKSYTSHYSNKSTKSNQGFNNTSNKFQRRQKFRQILNQKMQEEIAAIQGRPKGTVVTPTGVDFALVPSTTAITLHQRFAEL